MSHKINITLQPLGKTIKANANTPLLDILHEFGVEFPCGGKGTCGACKVKLIEGTLEVSKTHGERLKKLKLEDNWRLACYCNAQSDITLELSQFEHIILADNSTFEFTPKSGFGIAVDLGTTTIVTQLIDLKNGCIMDSLSDLNPQARYGADLIARIQSCLEGTQKTLQKLVHDTVGKMIENMLQKHPLEISKVVLVGNTVMHHIFCGKNVQPLSMYPFESEELASHTFFPKDLDWKLPEKSSIEFYGAIGSFVGSDILAGIAATKMIEKEAYTILIDLGTNGEIVVGNKNKILCASTAAGPAFEGAKISQGMRALTGAISSTSIKNGTFHNHVIGNGKPKGICGSGLIDVMAILLDQKKIGMFGEINSGEAEIKLCKEVSLTQNDIREFQLAKAALATGVELLLAQLHISIGDVEQVYIAGGFGNFLNLKNVIRTGLIEAEADKIHKLGNTALIGAKMFLFENNELSSTILGKTSHINLEAAPSFQDVYIEKMMLG